MCGIAGGAWIEGAAPLTATIVTRMTDAIRHRGPDDAGLYLSQSSRHAPRDERSASTPAKSDTHAALGHRRLSIIDLAAGHQPMSNEDGTVWIAFNGEIYNYRELRPDLEARGHTFATHTDTECIVHLYEEYGPDCVHHLRGMFAFAVWDDRQRRLFIARDRLGQKPLYYRQESNRLLFASELKAILQVPGLPARAEPRSGRHVPDVSVCP